MTDKPMAVGEVINHEWQEVSYGDFFHKYMKQILERTRVPGGWLYRTTIIDEGRISV